MKKDISKEIKEKRKKLEEVKIELKKKFFGIDDVIDKFISSIESWYFFPELRSKPLVVNLWGITGVGKTALVRAFVELINFEKCYCELSVANTDTYYLSSVLEDSGITYDSQAIVLIDEFQRLKTLNEKEEEIEAGELADLWTFLSDGSFPIPFNMSQRLDNLSDELKERKDIEKHKESIKMKQIDIYLTRRIFYALKECGIEITFDTFKDMTYKEATQFLEVAKQRSDTFKAKSFSKLLVIISGNLDEAFTFSKDVSDADTDPDVMSELSDDIKLTNIKQALTRRFRPEQIARLGNIHIIYPVLGKDAYNKLIDKEIDRIVTNYKAKTGIEFKIDKTLKDAIFANGVFPNQGVRPLFSTISMLLENPISFFATQAIEHGNYFLVLCYDKDNYQIYAELKDDYEKYTVKMTLDEIRDRESPNNELLFAAHEAGHAVIQALLFKIAPRQLLIKTSMVGTGGFCSTHPNKSNSKVQLLNEICVLLGGRAAEKFAFGENMMTAGASSDIRKATSDAILFNDFYGMNKVIGLYDGLDGFKWEQERQDEAKAILEEQLDKAYDLLKTNKNFFIEVTEALNKAGKLEPKEFQEIASKYGVEVKIMDLKDCIEENYTSMWDDFKKRSKFSIFK